VEVVVFVEDDLLETASTTSYKKDYTQQPGTKRCALSELQNRKDKMMVQAVKAFGEIPAVSKKLYLML